MYNTDYMDLDFREVLNGINIKPPSCNSEKGCHNNIDSLHTYFEEVHASVNNIYASLNDIEAIKYHPRYLEKTMEIQRQQDTCLDCKFKYIK